MPDIMPNTIEDKLSPAEQKERKAEQSRINGSKSKGPSSAEGKAISSANAVKHGFASIRNIVLAVEDVDEFRLNLEKTRACYKPRDYVEQTYVEQLASITWRQSRLVALESNFITAQMSLHDERVCAQHPDCADEDYFHFVQAWRALASPPRPRTAEELKDSMHPPVGYDIYSMDLVRRYQTSLDRQHRNTLLNLTLYRKNFAPEAAATPAAPQAPAEQNEPSPQPPPTA